MAAILWSLSRLMFSFFYVRFLSFVRCLSHHAATCQAPQGHGVSYNATCDEHVKTCNFEVKCMKHVFR